MMELFGENSQRFLVVYYFCEKGPSYMFDWVLYMPLHDVSVNIEFVQE